MAGPEGSAGGPTVPLSEDEQRILSEIEHQLRASDPDLARQVGETTVYSAPLRRTRLAVAGVIAGLALTVFLLSATNAVVAFLFGFVPMLACAIVLERGIRHLGRVGLEQLTTTVRASGVRDMFGTGPAPDGDQGDQPGRRSDDAS